MNKVDHIGIAVQSIQDALPFYTEQLGLQCMAIEEVASQKVKVAFLDAHNVKIELLEPLYQDGPIATFLKKRGEGIHHIAFGVSSIQERINDLKEKGIRMIDESPRRGAGGALVAFMHPKSAHGVLYELCEKEDQGER
ncbi:methylmalonyl-CoA/ethylmalonyl-CoA epimerase [Bacillus thermophilus]|uniref:Methylmalonyl-CoA/ethylmalonyl-CoA epimerase n=1 Tax=Siminovitchia thermophila TaxID=1245522 RepID=A0ABS2R264_9BACI|nr:methylmalonyl-CoA epimerase [Siminovitchia thermophila]MBM7713737.1 methylmalonyl-CoA/ethylmalonyl-CoA epimerase [Siminovitchia thermophila]ONK23615.1 methylmalonyl-CoA epimerase [Bacillus sp. VT-16-64]